LWETRPGGDQLGFCHRPNLEAISQGFAADQTSEEIDAIEDEVRPHAQMVHNSIDPQVIMGLKELPPEEED
jgi:hypothetical protein